MSEPQPDWSAATPSPVETARTWLSYADADHAAAEQLVGTGTNVPRWVSAFHSQQAAEKALKAGLIVSGQHAPKIHGLVELFLRLPDPDLLKVDEDDLEELEPWAVVGRYPGDLPEIDDQHALRLLGVARRTIEGCRGLVDAAG